MSERPPSSTDSASGRLQRCIRDLAALNALPAACLGRTPAETLDVLMDALPIVLGCELLLLSLPAVVANDRARVFGQEISGEALRQLTVALQGDVEDRPTTLPDGRSLWCWGVELPIGSRRGRFIVGRSTPPDPETDRVLVRSASNLVGTMLEAANVLDAAHRKDEFLAMLGHELRNPLAPIMTAVELLARHPGAAREQIVLDRQVRHMARIVDDLLDISRVTRGHVELQKEPVLLNNVLERAIELAQPLLMRRRHALLVGSAGNATVQGDQVRLTQVFANLLTNAAKFTPPEGRIDIVIEHEARSVRVMVRDNGRGIGREDLNRIFEPFVQTHRARDAAKGGLGLGLAIVKDLVERHEGTVGVSSAGEGQGATFSIELPTTAPLETTPPPPDPSTLDQHRGLRVLVVDDNIDVAQLLSEALTIQGFKTATAHDASSALEAWHRIEPQAGVLDLAMPDLDGYELARRLRTEYGPKPLLIAATGYGQPQDRARSVDAGFDCHFIKPVSIHELVRVLDQRLVAVARPA